MIFSKKDSYCSKKHPTSRILAKFAHPLRIIINLERNSGIYLERQYTAKCCPLSFSVSIFLEFPLLLFLYFSSLIVFASFFAHITCLIEEQRENVNVTLENKNNDSIGTFFSARALPLSLSLSLRTV